MLGCCVKNCGECRHGTVRALWLPFAVGLGSSLMRLCGARSHQWVFVQVFSPRFCGMYSNYFFSASLATHAMASGGTERNPLV